MPNWPIERSKKAASSSQQSLLLDAPQAVWVVLEALYIGELG